MFWWNYVVFVVFFRFVADLVGRAFRAARWLRSKQSPSCCAINFLWIWLAEGLIKSLSWAEQAYGLILLLLVLGVRRWWCDPVIFFVDIQMHCKNSLKIICQFYFKIVFSMFNFRTYMFMKHRVFTPCAKFYVMFCFWQFLLVSQWIFKCVDVWLSYLRNYYLGFWWLYSLILWLFLFWF